MSMKLGKDFVQWYLENRCIHSVNSIILHEERVGGNLQRFMICTRCLFRMDIRDYMIEAYEKDCDLQEEING